MDQAKYYILEQIPINEVAQHVHECAREHGWWNTMRGTPELLCLVHSEVSEALEAYREKNDALFREELADIVIRVFDMAAAMEIDIGAEIARKHEKNKARPYRHGGKRC